MTKQERSAMGKTSRRKGHAYELKIVRELKDMGIDCGTSRLHSRARDDAKVDIFILDKTPLNIQCKNNKIFHSPIPVLSEMPKDDNYNMVFQKIGHGKEYVTLAKKDFYEIINSLIKEGIWKKSKNI